jgi:hypothetical protein
MVEGPGGNGWDQHKRDVLHTLARIETKLDALGGDMTTLRERVRAVEVRAVGLSAIIAVVVSVIIRGLAP